MKIPFTPFEIGRKSNNIEQKSLSSRILSIDLSSPSGFLEMSLAGGITGDFSFLSTSECMSFYRKSSAVGTAVDIISQEIENITPVIKMRDGTLDDSHDILNLINNPNEENETYSDFIGQIAHSWLLCHKWFGYAEGAVRRPPLDIYCMKPQDVTAFDTGATRSPNSYFVGYGLGNGIYNRNVLGGNYGVRYYQRELRELWASNGYSSRTISNTPDSPLQAILTEIYQQIQGNVHNVSLLERGGRPSLLINFGPGNSGSLLTKEQMDQN